MKNKNAPAKSHTEIIKSLHWYNACGYKTFDDFFNQNLVFIKRFFWLNFCPPYIKETTIISSEPETIINTPVDFFIRQILRRIWTNLRSRNTIETYSVPPVAIAIPLILDPFTPPWVSATALVFVFVEKSGEILIAATQIGTEIVRAQRAINDTSSKSWLTTGSFFSLAHRLDTHLASGQVFILSPLYNRTLGIPYQLLQKHEWTQHVFGSTELVINAVPQVIFRIAPRLTMWINCIVILSQGLADVDPIALGVFSFLMFLDIIRHTTRMRKNRERTLYATNNQGLALFSAVSPLTVQVMSFLIVYFVANPLSPNQSALKVLLKLLPHLINAMLVIADFSLSNLSREIIERTTLDENNELGPVPGSTRRSIPFFQRCHDEGDGNGRLYIKKGSAIDAEKMVDNHLIEFSRKTPTYNSVEFEIV